jgi:rhodanese-related sulfurtransferase
MITEIDVKTLENKLKNKENFILLDVRTDREYFLSNIEGSLHMPMNTISEKYTSLDKDKETIVQCKSGVRSEKVCEFLLNNNFTNVKNLTGGIAEWEKQIDPTIIVY